MSDINNKLEKLFELNKRLSVEVQSSLPAIIESLGKSRFKYTSKALLSFIPKSGYLNSAILELAASRNIYSAASIIKKLEGIKLHGVLRAITMKQSATQRENFFFRIFLAIYNQITLAKAKKLGDS